MSPNPAEQEPSATPAPAAKESMSAHIAQNIESVLDLQRREQSSTAPSRRHLEKISRLVGRPGYLALILAFVCLWIGFNYWAPLFGRKAFDPPPFAWLDGLLTLVALLTTTVVLIAQNQQATLEQQRAHLDLQVNLLTEQKVTKLIHLLEELRRDLPMVHDRHDPQAAAMQERADAGQMASAIENVGLTERTRKNP
jgi:uncharacterized membrane protein